MKTKVQVLEFFKTAWPNKVGDRRAIEHLCHENGITVNFELLTPAADNVEHVSYEDFEAWFYKYVPTTGEVVSISPGKEIGLVSAVSRNEFVVAAFLTPKGKLEMREKSFSNDSASAADAPQCKAMQKALNGAKKAWDRRNGRMVDGLSLANNPQVRITLLGERLGIGVFREIDAEGRCVMYCLKLDGKQIRYSLHEVLGPADEYQIETIRLAERTELREELEKVGRRWEGHIARIEPVDYRDKNGGEYYYINDKLEIITSEDNDKPKDIERYRSGNYFRSKAEIEYMISAMKDIRKKQLMELSSIVVPERKRKKRSSRSSK